MSGASRSKATMNPAGFSPHALRSRILGEVHARPFVAMRPPRRVLHFAFMTSSEQVAAAKSQLAALLRSRGLAPLGDDARHVTCDLPPATLQWEAHNEFCTYAWRFAGAGEGAPFSPPAEDRAHAMRALPQPGPLICAVDLHLVEESAVVDGFDSYFGPTQLAVSDIEGGRAKVVTDFQPDESGFIRILIVNRDLTDLACGALIQRTLEIETYRTLALLGLSEAQKVGGEIDPIEAALPDIMQRMRDSEGVDANRRLLDEILGLAARLEAGAAASLFRFGATRAYDEIVHLRLEAIREAPVRDYATLSSFLRRRMSPAIRTCQNVEHRQADLSRKLSEATQLLRTRVDVELAAQNSDLLRRMGERVQLQLRLQQTVEGLSVAAITYYVASVFHHLFEGAHAAGLHVNPAIATAAVVPFVFVAVALIVRRIRKSHAVD